eukprot:jgi/Picsp_1/3988/NSC_01500-R1_---NA---
MREDDRAADSFAHIRQVSGPSPTKGILKASAGILLIFCVLTLKHRKTESGVKLGKDGQKQNNDDEFKNNFTSEEVMAKKSQVFLVFGNQRSGTTWFSALASSIGGVRLYHELFWRENRKPTGLPEALGSTFQGFRTLS